MDSTETSRRGRARRATRVAVTMCIVLSLAGVSTVTAGADAPRQPSGDGGDDRRPGFADGEWIGDMVAGFGFTIDGGGAGGSSGGGVFSLRVQGGNVTAGSYEASASGSFTSPIGAGASAVGTLTASGEITGEADKPIIANTVAKISATITVGGVSVPFEQDLGGDSMVITILSATCSVVIGTVEPEVRARVEGSVGITELSSRFVATRLGSSGSRTEDFSTEIVSLIVEGDEVVADAADGSLDITRFLTLLQRAERLAETIPRNTRCRGVGPGDHLATVAAIVQSLLQLIIDNPGPFGAVEIQAALEAAVRTGLAGPSGDPGLINDMRDVVGDKIAEAADAGDDIDVGRLGAAASMMGWTREAAAAAEYFEGGG